MTKKPHIEYNPPFLDDEEKDFIESFEAAMDDGKIQPHTQKQQDAIREDWQAVLENTIRRKAITLRVEERDIHRLKMQARELGLPYQTYLASVLHQIASGKTLQG